MKSTETRATATNEKGAIHNLFAQIAPFYDLANHVLSCGQDLRWRREAVRMVNPQPGWRVLDLCGGTGDFLGAALKQQPQLEGVIVDFAMPMLQRAHAKGAKKGWGVHLASADVLHLPIPDGWADLALMAFGLRNLADPAAGLAEALRVLKPGGTLAVLEFTPDSKGLLDRLFSWYFHQVLPRVGGLLTGHRSAYEYLTRSVDQFMDRNRLAGFLLETGFVHVQIQPLTFGVCTLFLAQLGLGSPPGNPAFWKDGT